MLKSNTALSKDRQTASHGVKMEHRHMAFIAAVLADGKPDAMALIAEADQWNSIVMDFARALQRNNPKFDVQRFHAACGYGG